MNQKLHQDPYIVSVHNCTDLNDIQYALQEIKRITGGSLTKYAQNRIAALQKKRSRLLSKMGLA